jgi:hypothetical protein
MLFMAIFTFDPEKRDAVIKRRVEKGPQTGGKLIGEWADIAGGGSFRVVEHDDPKAQQGRGRRLHTFESDATVPLTWLYLRAYTSSCQGGHIVPAECEVQSLWPVPLCGC